MEIITVQYRDGHDQTFESDGDLSETWTTLCDEPNVLYARYRVPARYTPSGTRTYGTIGISRGEAARLKAEHDAQVAAIQAGFERQFAARRDLRDAEDAMARARVAIDTMREALDRL